MVQGFVVSSVVEFESKLLHNSVLTILSFKPIRYCRDIFLCALGETLVVFVVRDIKVKLVEFLAILVIKISFAIAVHIRHVS